MVNKSTGKFGGVRDGTFPEAIDASHMIEALALHGSDAWSVSSVLLLSRVARLWEQALETILKAHGLIPAEMRVLSTLVSRPEETLTMSEIKRAVAVTAGGVTKAVARLEALGFVSKSPDPRDGRIVHVRTTGKGKTIAGKALRDVAVYFEDAFTNCDAEERDAMSLALNLLTSRLTVAR